MNTQRPRVLFLCTGNACRSQMAESLLRHHWGREVEALSAGVAPTEVHPLTLRVLAERGIDTAGLAAKGIEQFLGRVSIQHAVVVCENAQQHCPRIYPFCLRAHYWPFDDPAAAEGSEEQKLAKFREVRDQIDTRIRQWIREEGHLLTQEAGRRY